MCALCNRWDPEEQITPDDYVAWAETVCDTPAIYLYSYLYAEDPPRDVVVPTPNDINDSETRRSFRSRYRT